MIKITNESGEAYHLFSKIDPYAEGRRVLHAPVDPTLINPGESITILGYEPGVYYYIQPVKDPEVHRPCFQAPVSLEPPADSQEQQVDEAAGTTATSDEARSE